MMKTKHNANIDGFCWCNICEGYRGVSYTRDQAANFLLGLAMVVGAIVAIDFAGFILWKLSGQVPVDGFFIGGLTNLILK